MLTGLHELTNDGLLDDLLLINVHSSFNNNKVISVDNITHVEIINTC